MRIFQKGDLKKLYYPANDSSGEDNGQVTIIGGSTLFHGAPLLALKTASRIVDMVFFTSPEKSLGEVTVKLKSELSSFIWVPWEDVEAYIEKSDAVLIGPGLMRFASESQITNYDSVGNKTKEITEKLLKEFPNKKWVIDAGSLQTMEKGWIPDDAILTPNAKELSLLFGVNTFDKLGIDAKQSSSIKTTTQKSKLIQEKAREYNCVIVAKGPETLVCSPKECVSVKGGNPGLTKGGSGDVLAGLTVALLAKNDPFLAACAASFIEKASSDELYKKVGTNYNMDDLADRIPEAFRNLVNK
jgi:NAD(P)H-hydrate epimerase